MMGPAQKLSVMGFLLLAACGSLDEGGSWAPLPMERLRLSPVTVQGPPPEPHERKVCGRVPEELQGHLLDILPGRLQPVEFIPPEGPEKSDTGTLQVRILDCRLDSRQWDVGPAEPDIWVSASAG